jgi:hypothetical protein
VKKFEDCSSTHAQLEHQSLFITNLVQTCTLLYASCNVPFTTPSLIAPAELQKLEPMQVLASDEQGPAWLPDENGVLMS